ncbi:hypothetical protein PTTG_30301, partial [Puccinia triticina 1-1 BBBD Race 1]
MTPPKKTSSKPASRASSTRSSQPALVPPGEFKRGGSTPKLEPDNGVSIPNSPQIQAGVSGSPCGSEPGSHGNPAGPSNGDPPDSGAVDWPRNLAGSHRGLDSSIHAPQPPGSEVSEPTKSRPKPPSSLCTPQPRSYSTGSAPAIPSPRKSSKPNAGSSELQGVNLRGVVPHGQDDPGRLSGHRSVTLQEPRAQQLTLLKDRINMSSTSLLKSLLKDISSPISNNVQIVKDVVNEQFKAVKFSLTGIHTTSNSISSSSTYMTEVLDCLAAKIRAIEDIVRTTRPDDLKRGKNDLRNFVQTALDTAAAQVISGLPDNSKVIQVIQEVSARLSSVADQNRAILREIKFSRETAVPDDMLSNLSAVISAHIDKKFSELKLVGSLTATMPSTHIPSGASSVSAEVEQKLEEQSENQRADFLKLSDKIDRMMSQYRSEGARLREEIAALTDSVTKLRQSDQYRQAPPHFPQPEHQSPRYAQEGINPELKKRLNNAIAKSDWPTFSGDGEYDHLRFVRWIDTAKNDSHIDDEVIVLKLLTMLTGSALSWYETMRLTHQNTTWAFWKAEICKKFGHSAWKQKKQDAFSADKFVPGETTPAQW